MQQVQKPKIPKSKDNPLVKSKFLSRKAKMILEEL